ncbi:MAG: hypothetical protein ACYTGB_09050, partial [Planctomycetota bacterium]
SQGAGLPVIYFDRHCHGAVAYRVLAEEVDGMKIAAEPLPASTGAAGVRDVPVERVEAPAGTPSPTARARESKNPAGPGPAQPPA